MMEKAEIRGKCIILFSGSKGKSALIQARKELRFLRAELSETHPLRFQGEFAYYRMDHVTSVREFKKRCQKSGFPQYAWDVQQ